MSFQIPLLTKQLTPECGNSLIRNPTSQRTIKIQSLLAERRLCLTGTPMQNGVSDLQSLLKFLRIQPWSLGDLWKHCIMPNVKVLKPEAFTTINRVMEVISLRRTKEAVLIGLPKKIFHWVPVRFPEDGGWSMKYEDLYQQFLLLSRREEERNLNGFDESNFFQTLTQLRQFCNHPAFYNRENNGYTWADSPKVVDLVYRVKNFLSDGRGGTIKNPKVVIFSNFVSFLEM